MKNFYSAILFVVVGFVLGWMSRSYDIDRAQELIPPTTANPSGTSQTQHALDNRNGDQKNKDANQENPFHVPSVATPTKESANSQSPLTRSELNIANFSALLEERKFEQAMTMYREVDQLGEPPIANFKAVLMSKLNKLVEQKNADDFSTLANSYLSVYYNDIDVLLLLAKFNQQADYFIEAVSVYQMADEYAYTSAAKQDVRVSFNRFMQEVDHHYSAQQSWYMLRQVYERASLVNLLSPDQRIRFAQIYALTGDVYSGQSILETLIAEGQASKKARDMLQEITGQTSQASPSQTTGYESVVQLRQLGNQFSAALGLPNSNESVNLLLDTGASLTTLSSAAFYRITDQSHERIGARIFHTANGVVMGEVYRFPEIRFGQYVLRNIDIAVLDFVIDGHVDGLLGMNVLGLFRFQIDQQARQLLLTPIKP